MRFRRGALRFLPLVISSVVVVWCGFYLLFGTSSIFTLRALTVQQAGLEQTAATLTARRQEVEDRVVRMRPDSLDWDLVEQQARVKLGPPAETTSSLRM